MLKLLVCGDPHFKTSNKLATDALEECFTKLTTELNPDCIILLGDIFHTFSQVHTNAMKRGTRFIRGLAKVAPTYVLIGNHDIPNNKVFLGDEHGLVGMYGVENVHIIEYPTCYEINNEMIILCPYVPPGRFIEAMELCRNIPEGKTWKDANFIGSHQEFRGVKMSDSKGKDGAIVSVNGDPWPEDYPLMVAGHIHLYQQIADNLIYTGTPAQHEVDDNSKKTVSYFEITGKKYKHIRHELYLPKKILINVYNIDDSNNINIESYPSGSEIKVILHGDMGAINAMMSSLSIRHAKKLGAKISKDISPGIYDKGMANITTKRYIDDLYSKIKDDKLLCSLFSEMFGSIKTK